MTRIVLIAFVLLLLSALVACGTPEPTGGTPVVTAPIGPTETETATGSPSPTIVAATATVVATEGAPPTETATETATGEPTATAEPTTTATSAPRDPSEVRYEVETVASGLSVPWAMAFDADGTLYFTERVGSLRVVRDGALAPEPLAELDVAASGEGGLLGLALDPGFGQNSYLYLMYTRSDGGLLNRIARYTLTDGGLMDELILLDGIPGARNHDGGRLAFGPDGMLYATTGDAGRPELAQNLDSVAGKILRMQPDGSVPEDNPFPGSMVYSYGHRNPQGLAWHPDTGVLYSTEHGPSGEFGSCCRDEFNRIVPGGNYGWPYMAGNDVLDASGAAAIDAIAPVLSSGTGTWAPASLAFYRGEPLDGWDGLAFVTMLRGTDLQRITLGGDDLSEAAEAVRLFDGSYGRIRDVVTGPDGYLYFTTSNQDGRGQPAANDDRILRIVPAP